MFHFVAEHVRERAQQGGLVGGSKQLECPAVHVQHADLAQAARDEFRVDVGEDPEVGDAAVADLVEQTLDARKILNP